MTGMTKPAVAIRTARRSKRSSTTKTTSSFTPRCSSRSKSRRSSGLPLRQSRPWTATIMSVLTSSLMGTARLLQSLATTLDAFTYQEAADELPRIKPTPPPIPADRRGSGILVFFDHKPVNVQYEDVRRELRVAHCFRELDDVSHAFDHLIIMLLMLPRSTGRDAAVETIVNQKMEFFGHEDEANGLPRASSESGARREREALQGNVQRRPDGTVVYRHGQTG